MFSDLIPKRLARGQHMLNPGLGIGIATQAQEGFSLQIQEILFCYLCVGQYIPAAQDIPHLGRDRYVMISNKV